MFVLLALLDSVSTKGLGLIRRIGEITYHREHRNEIKPEVVMERGSIRRIREAVHVGRLPREFTPADVNKALGIDWAGTFLPKHRKGNPGRNAVLFVRVRTGVYRLSEA